MADDKPVIIIKKKGGHGGHHGGAWKVAYADFVTAMMAFFMVMWLVNSAATPTKQSIASYFRRPGLFEQGSGTPLMQGEAGILDDAYVPPHPYQDRKSKGKDQDIQNQVQTQKTPPEKKQEVEEAYLTQGNSAEEKEQQTKEMEELAQEIRQELSKIPDIKDILGDLEVKVEADGLVIEIMDTSKGSMFDLASARITGSAQMAFKQVAGMLAKFPNKLDIMGHTDAKPFGNRVGGYTNWELSSDRANAARRLLTEAGVAGDRILSVVGRADKDLRNKTNPMAAENRRITIKMRFADDVVRQGSLDDAFKNFKDEETKKLQPPKNMPVIDSSTNSSRDKTERKQSENTAPGGRTIPPLPSKNSRNTIALPEDSGTPEVQTSPGAKKDKIFGNSPVFGPPGLIDSN